MSTGLRKTCERIQIKVDSNKHIIEEIVRQIGYLPELYKEARSEKYIKTKKKYKKILSLFFSAYRGDCFGRAVHSLNNQVIKIIQTKKGYSN
jgi:hypothetical protein